VCCRGSSKSRRLDGGSGAMGRHLMGSRQMRRALWAASSGFIRLNRIVVDIKRHGRASGQNDGRRVAVARRRHDIIAQFLCRSSLQSIMTLIRTAIFLCTTCLVVVVAYGAVAIDPRFTLLLLPPLLALYSDERYLPESVSERLRNPRPMTKAFLSLMGIYFGLRITGCDVDGALQKMLGQKQGTTEEL